MKRFVEIIITILLAYVGVLGMTSHHYLISALYLFMSFTIMMCGL